MTRRIYACACTNLQDVFSFELAAHGVKLPALQNVAALVSASELTIAVKGAVKPEREQAASRHGVLQLRRKYKFAEGVEVYELRAPGGCGYGPKQLGGVHATVQRQLWPLWFFPEMLPTVASRGSLRGEEVHGSAAGPKRMLCALAAAA